MSMLILKNNCLNWIQEIFQQWVSISLRRTFLWIPSVLSDHSSPLMTIWSNLNRFTIPFHELDSNLLCIGSRTLSRLLLRVFWEAPTTLTKREECRKKGERLLSKTCNSWSLSPSRSTSSQCTKRSINSRSINSSRMRRGSIRRRSLSKRIRKGKRHSCASLIVKRNSTQFSMNSSNKPAYTTKKLSNNMNRVSLKWGETYRIYTLTSKESMSVRWSFTSRWSKTRTSSNPTSNW